MSETYVAQLFDLDAAIQHIYDRVPMELKGSDALTTSASEPLRRNSFCLQSIHCLCLSYLHGSAVPRISGITPQGSGTMILSRTSIRSILSITAHFLLISRTYCGSAPDWSAMPPSCYWNFFLAGIVCGNLAETTITSCKEASTHDLRFCCLMLEQLTPFWVTAAYLVSDFTTALDDRERISIFNGIFANLNKRTFLRERFPHAPNQSLHDSEIELSRSPILHNYALDDDIVDAMTAEADSEKTMPLQFEDIFELPSRMSASAVSHSRNDAARIQPQNSTINDGETVPIHWHEPLCATNAHSNKNPVLASPGGWTAMEDPVWGNNFVPDDMTELFDTVSTLAHP